MASEHQRACKRADISAEEARLSLERVMELVDVTVEDSDKWHGGRLRELLRLREVLAEFYISEKPDSSGMKKALRVLLDFDPAGSILSI
jgi:hypothetical protein